MPRTTTWDLRPTDPIVGLIEQSRRSANAAGGQTDQNSRRVGSRAQNMPSRNTAIKPPSKRAGDRS